MPGLPVLIFNSMDDCNNIQLGNSNFLVFKLMERCYCKYSELLSFISMLPVSPIRVIS